jgi:hypothetical protein
MIPDSTAIRRLLPCPWPSRSVSNVLNSHSIFENAIENFERIAHKRRNVQTGPLFDLRRDPRFPTNMLYDCTNTSFKRRGDSIAECAAAIGGYFAKIGDCAIGVFNLHARRKVRNAASTSSADATPLRSASSIASNSSGEA